MSLGPKVSIDLVANPDLANDSRIAAYRAGQELITPDFEWKRRRRREARCWNESARRRESKMTKIGPRTYSIASSDCPLVVNIQAQQMQVFQGVVSEALVTRDGVEVTRFPLDLVQPGEDPLFREFTIPGPAASSTPANGRYDPPASIHITFHGFFASATSAQPRYHVTVTSSGGDQETTSVRKPTVEPGVAHLTFQYLR